MRAHWRPTPAATNPCQYAPCTTVAASLCPGLSAERVGESPAHQGTRRRRSPTRRAPRRQATSRGCSAWQGRPHHTPRRAQSRPPPAGCPIGRRRARRNLPPLTAGSRAATTRSHPSRPRRCPPGRRTARQTPSAPRFLARPPASGLSPAPPQRRRGSPSARRGRGAGGHRLPKSRGPRPPRIPPGPRRQCPRTPTPGQSALTSLLRTRAQAPPPGRGRRR